MHRGDRSFKLELQSGFRFCFVFLCACGFLKAKLEILAGMKLFVLSAGTPKELRDEKKFSLRVLQDVMFKQKHRAEHRRYNSMI